MVVTLCMSPVGVVMENKLLDMAAVIKLEKLTFHDVDFSFRSFPFPQRIVCYLQAQ